MAGCKDVWCINDFLLAMGVDCRMIEPVHNCGCIIHLKLATRVGIRHFSAFISILVDIMGWSQQSIKALNYITSLNALRRTSTFAKSIVVRNVPLIRSTITSGHKEQ